MLKKKIIEELSKILKKNRKYISDIWLYGTISDQISDLDLIILYKNRPFQIILPNFLQKMVDDGTIIYIPNKYSKYIFLFEKLDVLSIKYKKKIGASTSLNYSLLRNLTSFLERYYERRALLLKTRDINPRSLRLVKSIIFSHQNFFEFCKYKKIKFKAKSLSFKNYDLLRKKFLTKKYNKNFFKKYLKKFKNYDDFFYKQSILVLDNHY